MNHTFVTYRFNVNVQIRFTDEEKIQKIISIWDTKAVTQYTEFATYTLPFFKDNH
jgi:hypothetical protein